MVKKNVRPLDFQPDAGFRRPTPTFKPKEDVMKRTRFLVALLLLPMVLLVLVRAGAQGPPPAGPIEDLRSQLNDIQDQIANLPPAWSQKLPANERFVVLADFSDAAVLDKETGLVWEQSPDADTLDWYQAQYHCYTREVGGRKGWRLPTIEQLASLVDSTQSNPALPSDHPFSNVQSDSDHYWSASTNPSEFFNAINAFVLFFNSGAVSSSGKDFRWHAWCVRGGHSFVDSTI